MDIKVATEVWIATALVHLEHPERGDFSTDEILERVEVESKLLRKYESVIPSVATVVPFDESAAPNYGRLRCDPVLLAPDAIQLACAGAFGVDLFVTNDARLQGKQVPGIQFIAALDRAPI